MTRPTKHWTRRGFFGVSTAAALLVTPRRAMASRKPRIPRVADAFVNIYKPGPDVFTLPTVKTRDGNHYYVQGTTYPDWRTNDHTFIKDDKGRLEVRGKGRDPNILLWNNTYHLLRCAGNGISLATSTDFIHWTDPDIIYRPERESYQTESPFLVSYDGLFYLFWTLWDTADKTTSGYCPRSYVHCSESPADFHGKPVLAEYTVHAPEIIQDEGGQWFMSTADHPHRGVSVAPVVWE